MWFFLLYFPLLLFLGCLSLCILYWIVLAAAYFLVEGVMEISSTTLNRFAILVPAHNEELLISRLCESLLRMSYPSELRRIFIICDNSTDRTAEISRSYPVEVLVRNDPSRIGKGFALSWALRNIELEQFDAVFIVDADNVVDPHILEELNRSINRGESAIQCYNSVDNRSDGWFTQILFVARTIGNLLYHESKYRLGLSAHLMGNGLCFTSSLLLERGWTAFTVGEDWEYYAQLIEAGIKISFAAKAKVFHQESRSLGQATSQRLRWASGKLGVTRKLGLKLFFKGVYSRNWFTVDASLPLLLPNWSMQINLVIVALLISFFMPVSAYRTVSIVWSIGIIMAHGLLLAAGLYLSGGYWDVFKAVLRAPLFLGWKCLIDFLSITGIYRGDIWVRTKRHIPMRDDEPKSG